MNGTPNSREVRPVINVGQIVIIRIGVNNKVSRHSAFISRHTLIWSHKTNMTIASITSITSVQERADLPLRLLFSDGEQCDYSLFWLLDNCPGGFHPQTGERLFDLLSVPDAPSVRSARLTSANQIVIEWQHDGPTSEFSADWLLERRPGMRRPDPASIAPRMWNAADFPRGVPRHDAKAILDSDEALLAWLTDTKRFGLTIVHGIEGGGLSSVAIARRIGFLRETNFGETFEVINKPQPNNLAYTALALPLHTDLTNQETPPGYQFLHCIANDATGGGSIFADGFALCQALRSADEAAFQTLATVSVPCRFFDKEVDIRVRRPVISLDENGDFLEVRFNAHLADFVDLPADVVDDWYRAYRSLMRLTRDPDFRLSFEMQAGEMTAFDNRRILHGRQSFDPATGLRHLHGCYVDRGEFDSRLRMLVTATQG